MREFATLEFFVFPFVGERRSNCSASQAQNPLYFGQEHASSSWPVDHELTSSKQLNKSPYSLESPKVACVTQLCGTNNA